MGVYRFLDFELDTGRYELRRQGQALHLQKIPLDLLILLVERKGDLIGREEIVDRLWGKDVFVDAESGVNTAIKKIRQTLGDDPEHPRFVQTVVGRGYRFVTDVQTVADPGPALDIPVNRRGQGKLSRRWPYWIVAACVLAGSFIAFRPSLWRNRLPARTSQKSIQSLAVLPLENLSGDASQQYFADGMTDALIADLGRIQGISVISRTSTMRYKNTNKSLPDIARELNVDGIVEGAVLRSNGRVRITAQLIRASDDRHVWAEKYERPLSDILVTQDEVARDIAIQIRARLAGPGRRVGRTIDPEAQDMYLRGRYEWNKWTEEGLIKSVGYFQSAVDKDPSYAEAWAGLSDAYGFLKLFGIWPAAVAIPKRKAAALKALELDDTLPEAHVAFAAVAMTSASDRSWATAETELKRAIALNPNHAMAHQYYGYLLCATARFEPAIAEMKRARELDPLSSNTQNSLGAALYWAGRYDDALQQFREVPDPDLNSELRHRRMADIYERKGMQKEAIAEIVESLPFGEKNELAASVRKAYASAGYFAAKKAFLLGDIRAEKARAQTSRRPVEALSIAADYVVLGDKKNALLWLDEAVHGDDGGIIYLNIDADFKALQPEPRFQAVLKELALTP